MMLAFAGLLTSHAGRTGYTISQARNYELSVKCVLAPLLALLSLLFPPLSLGLVFDIGLSSAFLPKLITDAVTK